MSSISDAFNQSAEASAQVDQDIDAALIEAGRTMAARIDAAVDEGEGQEITKALYLVPHLMNILREMYATPKARLDAGIGKEDARGKLAQVRELRSRPAPTKKRA